MANFQRNTASICNIKDLVNGEFIKKEGWDPSYVLTNYGKMFRVNIIGVVVSKNTNDCLLDDGTNKIILRSFTKNINTEIGDLVRIVGKPRSFNNELFINCELIKKIENKKWVDFRKKELLLRTKQNIVEKKEEYIHEKKEKVIKEEEYIQEKKEVEKKLSNAEIIIKLIEQLDSTDGASMEEVISKSNVIDAEKLIKNLMEEGEIFQIKPGKLKVM